MSPGAKVVTGDSVQNLHLILLHKLNVHINILLVNI